MPVTRLDDAGVSAILDGPRRLSLRFNAPQPVRDVLLLLVHRTGLSLAASPEVDGMFVGELVDLTLRQALDLVLEPLGLEYVLDGTAIRVASRRAESRSFDVNIITARRAGNTSGDAFDEVTAGVPALLSPDGRYSVDRKAGIVVVSDYPERLDRVGTYIESLERRLRRQVIIQARVVEVMTPDATRRAVDWTAAAKTARSGAASATAAMDFDAFVAALRAQGTVRLLASSEVPALHNEQATIRTGVEGTRFDGFALNVTPHITSDGEVLMKVAPAVMTEVAEAGTGRPIAPPASAIFDVSTAVRVRDGETLVLPALRRGHSEVAVILTAKVM
jgi:type II secretory pathway component GspD/PulD (secretin)